VPVEEHWQDEPEAHDFPAAADYLSLLAPAGEVTKVVAALRAAETVHYKAKDLLRASRLGLLPPDNIHVRKDLEKVANGKRLSPVLIVRGRADKGVPVTVADGYHRICASHHLDENADVPCRIVAWP
jgi:pimeloyl-ACP methyl ester carboxylesterase